MKKSLYIITSIIIWLLCSSCKTPRNIENDKQVDYSGNFSHIQGMIESVRTDFGKQTQTITDRISDLNIENKTIYLSLPDSTGKQYPIKESTTNAFKQDKEKTEVNEILYTSLCKLSNRLDTINHKINALFHQEEKVVELSWWDLHKDSISKTFLAFVIFFLAIYKTR